jgi:hypothetical protein
VQQSLKIEREMFDNSHVYPWFPQTTVPLLHLYTLIIALEGHCDVTNSPITQIRCDRISVVMVVVVVMVLVIVVVVVAEGGGTETLLFSLYTI